MLHDVEPPHPPPLPGEIQWNLYQTNANGSFAGVRLIEMSA